MAQETATARGAGVRGRYRVCPFPDCPERFRLLARLQDHQRIHSNAQPYVCSFEGCHRQFLQLYSLRSHIRVHKGQWPAQGLVSWPLTSVAATRTAAQRQRRSSPDATGWPCPVAGCDTVFQHRCSVGIHLRQHTGRRAYPCPAQGCSLRFITSGHRKQHLATHGRTGTWPCPFEGCKMRLKHKNSLGPHLRVHTGERPFVCPVPDCNSRFATQGHRKRHLFSHRFCYGATTALHRQASAPTHAAGRHIGSPSPRQDPATAPEPPPVSRPDLCDAKVPDAPVRPDADTTPPSDFAWREQAAGLAHLSGVAGAGSWPEEPDVLAPWLAPPTDPQMTFGELLEAAFADDPPFWRE